MPDIHPAWLFFLVPAFCWVAVIVLSAISTLWPVDAQKEAAARRRTAELIRKYIEAEMPHDGYQPLFDRGPGLPPKQGGCGQDR